VAIKKDVKVEINFPHIKGEVLFDTLSDSRLVKAAISAHTVLVIEEWLNQKTEYVFNRHQLIPENVKEYEELQKYSQFYVNSCSELLKPDTLLTFNEALFLLLGLNPSELIFPPFNKLDFTDYSPPLDFPSSLECVFFTLKHYQVLKRSAFIKNGTITSENLLILADANNFFNQEALHLLTHLESDNNDMSDNVNHKESTIKNRCLINKLAKEIIKNNPKINKELVAYQIHETLEKDYKITHLSDSSILRYINNYTSMKGKS